LFPLDDTACSDLAQGDTVAVTLGPASSSLSSTTATSTVTAGSDGSKTPAAKPVLVLGFCRVKAPGEVDPEADEVNFLKMPSLHVFSEGRQLKFWKLLNMKGEVH